MSTPVELALRAAPSQGRSRATFEHILDSAARLLEERGLSGFNTNLLSRRSGVSIHAIYRYFPNKHALVVELARRMSETWHDLLSDDYALADPRNDWRALWCDYVDHFVLAVRRTPGAAAILQAMRSDPDLRAVDDEANARYVRDIASALTRRRRRLRRSDADALAEVLIRSTVGVVDATLEISPARARRMVELLKTMHVDLLARYLDPA
jgi:AcrR family transcriptional regulator